MRWLNRRAGGWGWEVDEVEVRAASLHSLGSSPRKSRVGQRAVAAFFCPPPSLSDHCEGFCKILLRVCIVLRGYLSLSCSSLSLSHPSQTARRVLYFRVMLRDNNQRCQLSLSLSLRNCSAGTIINIVGWLAKRDRIVNRKRSIPRAFRLLIFRARGTMAPSRGFSLSSGQTCTPGVANRGGGASS